MGHQVSVDPVDDVGAQSLQWLHKYGFLRTQTFWSQSLLSKNTAQVVLHNSPFFAALLKEEGSNGGFFDYLSKRGTLMPVTSDP